MDVLPLRERNKQKVTERIIVAAMELFKTQGYEQTTMDDIANKAEISRGTLFNYFPSKDALLLPWGEDILDQFVQPRLTDYLATQPKTMDVLRFLFASMGESVLAAPDVIRAFVGEALKPNNKPQIERTRTGMLEIFVKVLRYGQVRGEVRSDIPLEDIAGYMSALQTGLLFHLLETGPLEDEDPSPAIARMMTFIAGGLAVPSEPK